MAKRPNMVLLDVNVLLDNYLPDRPEGPASQKLITWLKQNDVSITYPVSAPGTVFYLLQQGLKHRMREKGLALQHNTAAAIQSITWACIDNMAELGTPVGADASDFWLAREYQGIHGDLEDNFVLAAAERAQVDYLITNDKALLQKSTVPALSPSDFLQVLCS